MNSKQIDLPKNILTQPMVAAFTRGVEVGRNRVLEELRELLGIDDALDRLRRELYDEIHGTSD